MKVIGKPPLFYYGCPHIILLQDDHFFHRRAISSQNEECDNDKKRIEICLLAFCRVNLRGKFFFHQLLLPILLLSTWSEFRFFFGFPRAADQSLKSFYSMGNEGLYFECLYNPSVKTKMGVGKMKRLRLIKGYYHRYEAGSKQRQPKLFLPTLLTSSSS